MRRERQIELLERLAASGAHFEGMHADLGYQPGSLPITESVAQRVLSLPIFPELTHDEQHRVIEQVHAAVKQQALPV